MEVMMMQKNKRICAGVLALLCILLFPVPVFAAGAIDPAKDVSLTISYQHEDTPVSDVPFQLYCVAEIDQYAEFTLTGDFKDYPVRVNGLDSDAWRALAETLAGYVQRDGLIPLDSGKTDRSGLVVFPNQQQRLSPGLYLVTAEPITIDGYTYVTEPFLVSLPNLDKSSDTWQYDVSVAPKYTRTYNPPDRPNDETVDRKVLKIWDDGGASENRPKEITVQLLKDGKVFDTVRLNADCGWKHLWTDLPKYENGRLLVWRVVEQRVEDYTVSVTQEGITFVVTNTCEHPEIPDQPTPENPGPKLPQTGVLWWPVPVLTAVGLAFLAAGTLFLKKKDHE